MSKNAPGWYVVDHARNNEIVRGPFEHIETAAAIREAVEHSASEVQSEKWNLWVIKL